jgi:hypothetical protein
MDWAGIEPRPPRREADVGRQKLLLSIWRFSS